MTILTSVWSAQHPNAGQNIQQARHEELIVWIIDKRSLLLQAFYEVLPKGKKEEDVHKGQGGDLNLGPPERQQSVLTTTTCPVDCCEMQFFFTKKKQLAAAPTPVFSQTKRDKTR